MVLHGSSEDINGRKEFFGSNSYPAIPPTMGFFHCLQKEFMDFTNIILLVCAALYLVLGIKQKGAGEGWYDGVSIFAAIFLVISISATSNFRQNRKLDNLFEFNKNILVDVMRHGRSMFSKFEIVVGDIVCLKNGIRQLVGYFTGKTRDEFGNVEFIGSRTKVDDLIRSLVDITATAVIILVVAIRGGFSMAINLTLAHSTKRMMADQAVVRNLSAWNQAHQCSYSQLFPSYTIDEKSWAVLSWNMEMENQTVLNSQCEAILFGELGNRHFTENQADNRIHLHWKGDADIILPLCSHYYDSSGNMIPSLSEDEYENEAANQGVPDTNLVLLGLLGVEDHCHPGIREAFKARAMVLECGILSPGEEVSERLVVEAQAFFNYTEEEQRQRVGDIMVMAMSSDEHKRQMVQLLKVNGHVVAVTGDCANDAPTLQEANVGIAMGEQSTEAAKECSDILILDDNFANVVKVVRCVRCIRNNIQKFNQFQLTANLAFLMIYTVTILSSGNAPLTIAQVLWANLIINTLGALALATDKPTEAVMKQPVYHAHTYDNIM
ncbi:UNVERIFIED_CONTAM: putative calcium-transporting ATPase 13, plasma membrane-type [Sesamum angustifolium]|uniref:Calcium-transporting ATPase 13, plasma membrane-type n=1 Tax=Sesamum angustifolium TaxID=2727405 RepID=A0AAW2MIP8_9LAMI